MSRPDPDKQQSRFLDSATFYLIMQMQFSGISYSTTSPFPALKTLLQYNVLCFSPFLPLLHLTSYCNFSGRCNDVLLLCFSVFSAFWSLQQCTLSLSFLDSATMYFVSQLSGLCNECTLFPSFLDSATMVREAAVDLVGKFILHKQELIDKYYDMLLPRILVSPLSELLWTTNSSEVKGGLSWG